MRRKKRERCKMNKFIETLKRVLSSIKKLLNKILNKENLNKENLLHFAKKYKIYLIAIAVVIVAIGGGCYAYSHRDKSAVKVCESTIDYNKGIGLTFYVGKDGETIDKIEKVDTVSLEFIKKNLSEENAQEILNEYKTNAKFLYEDTLNKYKDVSWFKADIHEEDGMMRTTYTFDVSSKDFNYDKYKSLIEEFSLEYYYNKDAGKFIYNEEEFLSQNTPLGNIESVGCYTSEVKIEKKESIKEEVTDNKSDKKDKEKKEDDKKVEKTEDKKSNKK